MKKSLQAVGVLVCLAALILVATAFFQGYGSYKDTGAGLFSNQGWCNEITNNGGNTTGCAPDILFNAVTTTAQAAANVSTDQKLVEVPLQPNTLIKLAKHLIVKGSGTYSLGAASTVAIKVKLCTVSGCGSGTVVTPCTWTTASNTNTAVTSPFNFECDIVTSTSSAANSKVLGHGPLSIEVGAAATAAATQFNDVTTAESAVIDLTAADFLDTSITFGTANASNTATQQATLVALAASLY